MTKDLRAPLPLAVTIGEPAGVGPDLALMAHSARGNGVPPFYVLGDIDCLAERAKRLGLSTRLRAVEPSEAAAVFSDALPVVDFGKPARARPGRPDPRDAGLVLNAIEVAVEDVRRGRAAAVVTAPIHKASLYEAGFRFPGHTEYLGELAAGFGEGPYRPVMMLAGPELRTVPLTVHVPLRAAPDLLTETLILETARIVARDLTHRFGIARPRLVVGGLNPHAGEDGTMGGEELDVIGPAVVRLRAEGLDVRGPIAADSMFHPAARAGYDAALMPTHDQALIPVKTIAFDETVNVTLGLPFLRTSPDHGTALDIAGSGAVRPESFIAALRMAARLTAV